ncbi:MAG TPA: tRNA pseudouridine(55) synthase TruB [Clostridiaceae bacterium]|nr:tRNA pseudouridine(55) synthase TruB [Clostridiaceae bacterium]
MDGIILIDKPKGVTSHDIVYKVKKLLNEKVGHTGTLDPNATGVLPLLVGRGTKLSKYLINHDKTYIVTLKLGEKTDTADSEGKVIEKKEVSKEVFSKEKLLQTFSNFTGKILQIPPIYSAIKVNGKKLYEYARKGQEVEIKPRQIEIYKISLIEINQIANTIEFEVSCSKGTYIRSLCEDIAKELNTVGYMKELRRVQVGEFLIKDSITVEDLQKNEDNKDFILSHFIDLQKYFAKFRIIELSQEEARKFLNGVKLSSNKENGIYRVQSENKLIGTGILENNKLKRDIIILT